MEYEVFLELVKSRRSTRRFTPEPVSDGDIDKILEAARWAPSGFNLQPWEFVVVRDRKLKDGIVQLIREHDTLYSRMESARESWHVKSKVQASSARNKATSDDYSEAPVFILLLGDTRTNAGLPMTRRYNYHQTQLAFISGMANAMLYMHLAATTMGLGSQWLSSVGQPYVQCMVKNLLGIPFELEVYDMMAVGYGAYKPSPRQVRERKEMAHFDYCGEGAFRTDRAVRDFIIETRNRSWQVARKE